MARPPAKPENAAANARRRKAHLLRQKVSVVDGVKQRSWEDPATGLTYPSRRAMEAATRRAARLVVTDFGRLVREKSLGQDPWARLPGETPLDYSRFQSYLTLGPDRRVVGADGHLFHSPALHSLDRVAHHLGVGLGVVKKTASTFHWALRADLWGRHIEGIELEEHARAVRLSAARQARLGQRLQNVGLKAADLLAQDPERLASMSGNEIAKIVDVGVKVERLAMHDPTKIEKEDRTVSIVWSGPKPAWADAGEDGQTVGHPQTLEGKVASSG